MAQQMPSDTKKLFLTFYAMTGKLPPDSYQERHCSCGYEGIFDLPARSQTQSKRQFRFAFQCPQCAHEVSYLLGIPLGIRLSRAKKHLLAGLKRRKITAFAGAFAIAVMAVAANRYSAAEGWRLLREAGPTAALEWIKDPRTPRERYIQAWTHFAKGELEKAEVLNRPLQRTKIDLKTRADAFYLAGLLEERKGSGKAMELFGGAVDLYADLGKSQNLQQTYLTMAYHLVNQDDYGLAERYWDMANTLSAESSNRAYLHEVESELHFGLGRYDDALIASRESLVAYEGRDVVATARMKSNVGFYQILNGDPEGGLWTSLEAERIILEQGLGKLYQYNLLNFYLHQKCVGLGGEAYAKMIEAAIEKNKDPTLKRYLNFARAFECLDLSNKGDHTPPPPPN